LNSKDRTFNKQAILHRRCWFNKRFCAIGAGHWSNHRQCISKLWFRWT